MSCASHTPTFGSGRPKEERQSPRTSTLPKGQCLGYRQKGSWETWFLRDLLLGNLRIRARHHDAMILRSGEGDQTSLRVTKHVCSTSPNCLIPIQVCKGKILLLKSMLIRGVSCSSNQWWFLLKKSTFGSRWGGIFLERK